MRLTGVILPLMMVQVRKAHARFFLLVHLRQSPKDASTGKPVTRATYRPRFSGEDRRPPPQHEQRRHGQRAHDASAHRRPLWPCANWFSWPHQPAWQAEKLHNNRSRPPHTPRPRAGGWRAWCAFAAARPSGSSAKHNSKLVLERAARRAFVRSRKVSYSSNCRASVLFCLLTRAETSPFFG